MITSRRKGFALIVVMICIVLAVTMAVFFLSSAGKERTGVNLYARGSQARHLSGMAVNKVIGQINQATKEGTATTPRSWASQPGMVRTFSGNQTSNVYKLYSWDNMLESGSGFNPSDAAQVPTSDWKSKTALFTDLNQPINGIYPIVDPAAEGSVQGFSIDKTNTAVSNSISANGSAAPMPVKWLYVLEDGQMVAPTGGSGGSATIPNATSSNPIVGRVAFWTDDETAKVNINTASEGAFWDWPKAATYNEMQFAGNPPVGGEFNRVPGHPSMTSLSAVFPELDPGDRWAGVANYRTKLRNLLGLTPRVPYSDASSRGGTYPIETQNFDYGPKVGGVQPSLPIPSASLNLKTDRLYASPDEFFFSFNATDRTPLASQSITADMLQRRLFFLTANSRAPETTLFETPRVSLWPITWPYATAHASLANRQTAAVSSPAPDSTALSSNTWMRAEEKLLAFDATLNSANATSGGDRYYFQRQNCESPTHDYANITRNQRLLSYLQNLTSKEVPGYGGSFASKYTPAIRNEILANTFNSIRSLVNQYTFSNNGTLLYSYTPVSFARFTKTNSATPVKNYKESGAFSPAPLKINLGTGEITSLNEFPSLREVALVFYATDRILPSKKAGAGLNYNDPLNWDNLINVSGVGGYPVGARTTAMRAVILLDFSSLRGSSRSNQPVFWLKISGGNLNANGSNLFPAIVNAKMDYQALNSGKLIPSYILPLFSKSATAVTGAKTFFSGDVTDTNYGLVSADITMDPLAQEFTFSGGNMSIEVYASDPTSSPNSLIGTYAVDFSSWNGSQKIPIAPRWNYFDRMNEKKTTATDPKTSECPNPGFNAASNWAAIEIAPRYSDANAAADPALGGTSSIPTFGTLYNNSGGNQSINYPTFGTSSGNQSFRAPPTFVYQSSVGAFMTDYQKRMEFFYAFMNRNLYAKAENSLYDLNPTGGSGNMFSPGGFPATTVYDTVLSVAPDPAGSGQGDPRFAQKFSFKSVKDLIGASAQLKQVLTSQYGNPTKQYHTLGTSSGFPSATGYITSTSYSLLGNTIATNGMALAGRYTGTENLGQGSSSVESATLTLESNVVGVASMRPTSSIGASASVGDWASGAGYLSDGGQLSRPDQDFQSLDAITPAPTAVNNVTFITPYFPFYNDSSMDGINTPSSKGYFSPNRQIPSPISLLGSIPSSTTTGWQSLLFSPNPAAGATHPGLAGLPDYVFLDLFWMPVAEPYPISEQFSTAGKINLNYKIMPFPYINRSTGLHALLKSTWMTALDNSLSRNYKSHFYVRGMANSQTRYSINATETVKRFDTSVFDSGKIFRSAAEICSIWMVPQGQTASNAQSFWNGKLLTSDTAREQPYDHIYSRVTTKSNTFTVHWRAQALQKVPGTAAETWDDTKDRMAAELRGSTLIERYIDPNATNIPDYATNPTATPLSNYYKWRTISESFFQPK